MRSRTRDVEQVDRESRTKAILWRHSVLEERLEQVREIDGEQAYEKMRRAVEKASQEKARQVERARLEWARQETAKQTRERRGPERDFDPSR